MCQDINILESYPYNLLVAIKGLAEREIPVTLTQDHWAGLTYVLGLLEDREKGILLMRYEEGKSRSEIGAEYDISPERVRQVESKACRKLQRLPNWNYIYYGVAGYLRKVASTEYNRGYSSGYEEGYKDGVKDGASGVVRDYGSNELLNQPVEYMNLSMRAQNCIKLSRCTRIGDIVRMDTDQIRCMRQLGKVTANEIAQALKQLGVGHSVWDEYLL